MAAATASGDAAEITACVDTMRAALARDAEDFASALTERLPEAFLDLVERTEALVAEEVASSPPPSTPACCDPTCTSGVAEPRRVRRDGRRPRGAPRGDIGSRAAGDLAVRTFLSGASA